MYGNEIYVSVVSLSKYFLVIYFWTFPFNIFKLWLTVSN